MAVGRARAGQAAEAQRAARHAAAAAAAAADDAAGTRWEAAELYDAWRLRTSRAEAAAGAALEAELGARAAAEEAAWKLAEAVEQLAGAETRCEDAGETVAWQGRRIVELEGRRGEQTRREYGAELAKLRKQVWFDFRLSGTKFKT